MNEISNFLNKENNFQANQKAIGMREVFRGVVVKSWVALLLQSIHLKKKIMQFW